MQFAVGTGDGVQPVSPTQHMQTALEQLNVKLTELVADITGMTGERIIAAILVGERDPIKVASCLPVR